MTHRTFNLSVFSTAVIGILLSLLTPATASAQEEPMPFACTGEAFVVQGTAAQLFEIDQTIRPFDFDPIDDLNDNGACDPGEGCNLECPPDAIEVNGMGFRRTDGYLYAVAVDLAAGTNDKLIRIDSKGTVEDLGRPPELPDDVGLNAGDISTDGSTMYLTWHNDPNLWIVDLTNLPALSATSKEITGDRGIVLDWAYNPIDGKLYGGDRDGSGGFGQVAQLDPGSGVRKDYDVAAALGAPPLPAGAPTQYGGAWFNAAGTLFVFENGGTIYEVSLGANLASPSPTVVGTLDGPSSSRNDTAACVQDLLGAAKSMTVTSDPGVWPATIEIKYTFEAFKGDLFALSAIDDLREVFGEHGVDWSFLSISSVPVLFANPAFDGHADVELVSGMPPQSMTAGEVVTVTVGIEVLTLDFVLPDTEFCNQVLVLADNAAGVRFGDLSTAGCDPDPDGDGAPDEREPACVELPCLPSVELVKTGELDRGPNGTADPGDLLHYQLQVTNTGNVTLTDLTLDDPGVAAVACPGGHPIPALAPGATEVCTASYAITHDDLVAGERHNSATVTAQAPCGGAVEDQDQHWWFLTPLCEDDEDGDLIVVQGLDSELFRFDDPGLPSPIPAASACGPLGLELNNAGFRSSDGLLYGVEVELDPYPGVNHGIVKIDGDCSVVSLGVPSGTWPSTGVNAGVVAGSTMYVSLSGQGVLYVVDLMAFSSTSKTLSGPAGPDNVVLDWAYQGGLLYGADRQGEMAVLDPGTGNRTDHPLTVAAGVDASGFVGGDFGGAWFDAGGDLFVHANAGRVFKIDVTALEIVDSWDGLDSSRNDAAVCRP